MNAPFLIRYAAPPLTLRRLHLAVVAALYYSP